MTLNFFRRNEVTFFPVRLQIINAKSNIAFFRHEFPSVRWNPRLERLHNIRFSGYFTYLSDEFFAVILNSSFFLLPFDNDSDVM